MAAPHPDEIQFYMEKYKVDHKRAKCIAKYKIFHEVKINRKNERAALTWLHHEMKIPFSQIMMWHGGRFMLADQKVATMLKLRYA